MDLKVQDIAELMHVSSATVERWVNEAVLPSYTLQGEIRFSRDEIENWMMNSLASSALLPFGNEIGSESPWQQFGLYRAIHKGGVISNISSTKKEVIIAETMEKMAPKMGIDSEVAVELLLDREMLMPTSIGHGIAVPHTREFLLKGFSDTVLVVYPESPMEWGALDETAVHTIFFLFACDDKRHLSLLAKIAHLTSSPEALEFFQTKPDKQKVLEQVKRLESKMKSPSTLLSV